MCLSIAAVAIPVGFAAKTARAVRPRACAPDGLAVGGSIILVDQSVARLVSGQPVRLSVRATVVCHTVSSLSRIAPNSA